MSEAEQWLYILGGGLALLVAAGVVLSLVVMVVRLVWRVATFSPRLEPIARQPVPVGVPHRMSYLAHGRPHGLWLAIDARWPGGRAWQVEVELRVHGARAPIAASFPLGEGTSDDSITSPLVSGLTAVGTSGHFGIFRSHVATTCKLCDVVPAAPGAPIVIDVAVRPGIRFEALTLALVAAPDPPMPALPAGLG